MNTSVFIATSLDGFIARPDGDVSWLDPYVEDCGFNDFFNSIDCLVLGRKSFEKILSFDADWPYGEKHVVVLSETGVEIPTDLAETTELMSGSPVDISTNLGKQGFSHLYIDGGSTIRGFLDAGLVNAITLTQVPILLGAGIPLFGGLQNEVELNHIKTQCFDNGLVQSEYRVSLKV